MLDHVIRAGACAVVVVLVGAARVEARPTVHLAVDGDCPTTDQVRTALADWVDVSDADAGAEWTIAVSERSGAAELAVRDGSGGVALSRRLSSRDCAAVADAFAVMVYAHFV